MTFALLFRLSGLRLALPAEEVSELVLEPRLARPPAAPPVIDGILNLRGRAVPVMRLWRLLDIPEPRPGPFRPVVVLSRPLAWAFVAEAVEWVGDAPPVPPPTVDLAFNDCVASFVAVEDRMVPVLAPERLLRRAEAQALDAFATQAAQRMKEFAGADE